MNNKHFIWIVPMLLITGFTIGYISGLNIPNSIEFGLDKKTIDFMDKYYNLTVLSVNFTENLQREHINLQNQSFSTCEFDTIDITKYYCCESTYRVKFAESRDWMCLEDKWQGDLNNVID